MTFPARAVGLVGALIIGLLAGMAPQGWVTAEAAGSKPRVVVAVVDSAVNPYHEYFHAGGPLYGDSAPSSVTPAVLKEFGIDRDHVIHLTRTGDFAADFKKNSAQFDKIEKGEPYWFEGTNVIGISFLKDGERLRPDGRQSPHGVGTVGAVLGANPDAIVVSVDGINNDSEKWAFSHPSVDIVTTSYGPATGIPTLNHLSFSYSGVVKKGKVHFGAATNDPSLAWPDETSGPWWSIGVSGFEEGSTGGRQLLSGSSPDFVGDWTQELPYCRSCEKGMEEVSGTSFASPRSAGTFSKVLLEARRAVGHEGAGIVKTKAGPFLVVGQKWFSNWDMRRALEEAAYYPGIGDYQPGGETSVPVNDAAPWIQAGWGLITPDPDLEVVRETLAHLGIGGKPRRSKPAAACEFMTANMEARHAYWDNFAVFGQGFGKREDPYIYC